MFEMLFERAARLQKDLTQPGGVFFAINEADDTFQLVPPKLFRTMVYLMLKHKTDLERERYVTGLETVASIFRSLRNERAESVGA